MVNVPKPAKVIEIDDDGEVHPAPDDADELDEDEAEDETDDEQTPALDRQ